MFQKPARHVDKVFLHCSASDRPEDDDVSVMRAWHLARGWREVGYHYFVKKDGTVQLGRDLEKMPAAQGPGLNEGTIAICAHGLKKEAFTEAQLTAVRDLCEEIDHAYAGQVTFHGHCEVANKLCPVYDYRSLLSLDATGHMHRLWMTPVAASNEHLWPVLARGSSGGEVLILQALLKMADADGRFGPHTEKTVQAFQKEHGLPITGKVGYPEWATLIHLNQR